MANVIIWTHPVSGNVCRTVPMEEDRFDGESEEDWFFRAAVHAVPEGVSWRVVDSASLPPDNGNEFDRAAWVDDGATVAISPARRATLTAAKLVESKAQAVNAFDNQKSDPVLLIQAGQLASLDQINVLRLQTVGIAAPTWDAPSIANGAGATSPNVTVTGAAFGDSVEVSCSVSTQGLIAYGWVSAANTVNVRLHNGTGAAINLPSAQWKVVVRRYAATPEISVATAKAAIKSRVDTPDVG
jgi:hypothetical protein